MLKEYDKQVCIPVGCILPTCHLYLPACTVGVSASGVSAPGECLLPGCLLCGGVCFGGVCTIDVSVLGVGGVCSLGSRCLLPVYHDKGTPPKKGGGSSYTVTKLPSSLEPKGQRPLSLPHSR